MTTGADALRAAIARLRQAGVPDPARDARLLLADALGLASARLGLALPEAVPDAAASAFAERIAARCARRPVSQILGRRAFWGRDFEVTAEVLDPRPETETLVARALDGPPARHLLDLGMGSGILAVTLLAEWPDAQGLAVDISPAALGVARRNAVRHGVEARLAFALSDWGAAVERSFDLVVCNPPYIPETELSALAPEVRDWEPAAALSPGQSGLEAYQRIARDLPRLLVPCGRALFEVGSGQGEDVAAILAEAGLAATRVHPDLDGRGRVVEVAREEAPRP